MSDYDLIVDERLRELVRATLQRAADMQRSLFIAISDGAQLFSADATLPELLAHFLRRAAGFAFPRGTVQTDFAPPQAYAEVDDAPLRTLMEQAVDRAAKLGNVHCFLALQLLAEPLNTRCIAVGTVPPDSASFLQTCFHVALVGIVGAHTIAEAYRSASPPRESIN